jgi:hypothetical protein
VRKDDEECLITEQPINNLTYIDKGNTTGYNDDKPPSISEFRLMSFYQTHGVAPLQPSEF